MRQWIWLFAALTLIVAGQEYVEMSADAGEIRLQGLGGQTWVCDDFDGDGICDTEEMGPFTSPGRTNMYLPDSDGDGLWDGVEDANKNGIRDKKETGARLRDSDGDRFEDGIEVFFLGSDPLSSDDPGGKYLDFDGDGLPDTLDRDDTVPDTDGDRYMDSYDATWFQNLDAVVDPNLVPQLGNVLVNPSDPPNRVDNADCQMVLNFFGHVTTSEYFSPVNSDVNRDSFIDNADAQMILQYFGHNLLMFPAISSGGPTPTPEPTDTPEPTNTLTPTFTNTSTRTPTQTFTSTVTNTPTATPYANPVCVAPRPATGPEPADGATGVSPNSTLRWNQNVSPGLGGGRVLWDLSHGPYMSYHPTGYFSTLAGILAENGYLIETTETGVLSVDLLDYDGLIVCAASAYDSAYTAPEVTAIQSYVSAGGGLLILAENAALSPNINPVAAAFGIQAGVSTISSSDVYFGNFHPHPIFVDVSEIYYRSAGRLTASAPGELCAWYGNDGVVATAIYGTGRVVVTGDCNFCDNSYIDYSDNIQFIKNIFGWALSYCQEKYTLRIRQLGALKWQINTNLHVPSFKPATLASGTDYEWKITSFSGSAYTEGPVWSFRVAAGTATATRTNTPTNTRTHTPTRTNTPTWTRTNTPTRTRTNTPTPNTGTLYGYILSSGGTGISGARVQLYPGDQTATTNASGYYQFTTLTPGTYYILAAKDGYNLNRGSRTVSANASSQRDLTITTSNNSFYFRGWSVEDFVDGNEDLSWTHESAAGYLNNFPAWEGYYRSYHHQDSQVTRQYFHDTRRTGLTSDDDHSSIGLDRCTHGFLSSHAGMTEALDNVAFCMGDTAGHAWTSRMLVGSNRPDKSLGICRYFHGDACNTLGRDAAIQVGPWWQAVDGIRMIFGFATVSVDSRRYGEYFWEEWKKAGAKNITAWLDASWRIRTSQMPAGVAYGPNSTIAVSRRDNDEYFYSVYAQPAHAAWIGYNPTTSASHLEVPSAEPLRSLKAEDRSLTIAYKPFVLEQSVVDAERDRFGLSGTPEIKESEKNLGLIYENGYLNVSSISGAVDFRRKNAGTESEGRCTASLDARILQADKILSGLSLAEKGTYALMETSEIRAGGQSSDGVNDPEYRVATRVIFRRIVNGIPATGPGGRIEILLDDAGLVRVRKIWREIESVQFGPVPDGAQAYSLDSANAALLAEYPGTKVLESELGFYAADESEEQTSSGLVLNAVLERPQGRAILIVRPIE